MLEKGVQLGLPISRSGFCSSSSLSALALCAGMLKFHGAPVSSLTVRSRAIPGIMPNLGCLRAVAVTRGAEYTSETIALSLRVLSLLYFLPLPPMELTISNISSYLLARNEAL